MSERLPIVGSPTTLASGLVVSRAVAQAAKVAGRKTTRFAKADWKRLRRLLLELDDLGMYANTACKSCASRVDIKIDDATGDIHVRCNCLDRVVFKRAIA